MAHLNCHVSMRFSLISFLIFGTAAFVCYDLTVNAKEASTTHRFLRDSGITDYYLKWSKDFHRKYPHFYKDMERLFSRYLQTFYRLHYLVLDFFYTLFEPIIKWLNHNGITVASVNHYFHEKVKPRIIADFYKLQMGAEQLLFSTHKMVNEYAYHLGVWFHDNFPTGSKSFNNMQGSMINFIQSLQASCIHLFRWMHTAVLG